MRYSIYPIYTDEQRAEYKASLLSLLANPTLSGDRYGTALPEKAYIYIDNRCVRLIRQGTWENTGDQIFYPGRAPYEGDYKMDYMARLAVLMCLALLIQADEDPTVVEAFGKAFEVGVKMGRIQSHELVISRIPPSQMACSPDLSKFAAKLDGKWYSPTGIEVEIDDTWLVMDC